MKKITQLLPILILLLFTGSISRAQAPTCGATVPFYIVDLRGTPGGSWESPAFSRLGYCCGASGSTNCASFQLFLDSNTAMVNFDIASGAIPSGVMYYQIDCGALVPVGSPICLSGSPHYLTFCKPGNNTNTYRVTAIPKPGFPRDDSARIGCSRLLRFQGLSPSSITWTSIYPGAAGAYNSSLTLIDSTHLLYTPAAGAPAYVDYKICGTPYATSCGYLSFCDTVRVTVFPALSGEVDPTSPSFCAGSSGVAITAAGTGGASPYTYIWYNSAGTTVSTSATYTASVAGTYSVEVRDLLYTTALCPGFVRTVSVTTANTPVVNAGADQIVCASSPLTHLSGSVTYATGIWSGGAGTFSAGATSPVTDYTPTASEIAAGYVDLILTSTGAGGGCLNKADTVHITYSPIVNLSTSASAVLCNGGNTGSATAMASGGYSPFIYSWSTSPVQTTSMATALGVGTYTVTVTDAHSCTAASSVTITQPAALTTAASTLANVSCNGGSNGSVTVVPTGGTTPYTYSWSSSSGQTAATATGLPAGTYTVTVTDANSCASTASATVTQPTLLNATASTLTNVSCNGGNNGSASVSPSGGTTPYTYSWSSSPVQTAATATGLAAGTYTVTVTDANSCTKAVAATITQPTALNATSSTLTNVSCNGGNNGSVSVAPSGGTTPYTYSWSSSPVQTAATATGLPAGTYTVTVTDAQSCTKSVTATVTQPAALAATASTLTNVACNGGSNGSVSVTPSGGTTPYSYSWSTTPEQTAATATGLMAGTYTVTVTDAHSCSTTANATVTQPTALSATASTLTDVSCNGGSNGSASVTPSGGTTPYTYVWSSTPVKTTATATGLPAGTYTVTVTDGHNCTATATATIAQPTLLVATASTLTNVSCNGGIDGSANVVASGGTTPYTYSWNSSPAQTTPTATSLPVGSYTVTVTDAQGCFKKATATITQPPILNATASTTAHVSCYGGSNGAAIVNPSGGTTPYTYSWSSSPVQTTSSATGLPAGTYTVTVTDAHGCTKSVTATINQPTALTATATTLSNALCNGINTGSVSVSPSGGSTPYSYTWSTSPVQTAATATGLTAGTYTATVTDSHGCTTTASSTVTQPSTLAATASTISDVLCNGGNNGSVTVSASGGTTPYTYAWNTSPVRTTATITGLVAGTYVVTVTDANGCTITAGTTVTQPTALAATTSTLSNVSCNGGNNGSVSVAPSGGTLPYTYLWSSSPVQTSATATGLMAGTYTVTVTDAHSCTKTVTATVSQPSALAATASTLTNVACNGGSNGSVSVSPSGGTSPYSFSWNSVPAQNTATATGLVAGTYVVTVTDAHGCMTTATATVTEPTALAATASTLTNVACNGANNGSVSVAPSGGSTPYVYSWSSSPVQTAATATGLPAGTYVVTVTDAHNCTATATAAVTQPTSLAAAASTLTNVSCYGGNNGSASVTPTGGTLPYTYSWNSSPAQTSSTATGLVAGTYTVTVRDAHNCVVNASATITQPTMLSATASTLANVSCNGGNNGAVSVTPSGGTTPYAFSWNSVPVQTTAAASGLPSGTYMATVTDANGCTATATATVTQPTALVATASTISNALCNGVNTGAVSVSPSGGTSPYTYTWSTAPVQTSATATGLGAGTYSVVVTDAHNCTVTAASTVTQPSSLAATASTLTDVACNGGNNGSVTVNATGGTTPYSYNWNTTPVRTTATISGLVAGTYVVTVSDANNCTVTSSTVVTQPAVLTTTGSTLANVACNGGANGSVSVVAGGGTAPYTYNWSTSPMQTTPMATGLPAGTYTVVVTDAHSCSSTATAIVTQPTALAATASTLANVACNGGNDGSVSVTPAGGTSPYTFSWSTSLIQTGATATELIAGSYVVTVTDAHNCTATATATVTQPIALAATANTLTNASCNGANNGSVSVTPSGGTSPYTYSWNTSPVRTTAVASGLPSGTYTVVVTDAHNCSVTASTTVTQPTTLTATASTLADVLCNGGNNGSVTVAPTGGTFPYTYSWNTAPVQTNATATGLVAGTYTATVTDAQGCSTTVTATVAQPTSLAATASTLTNVLCNGGHDGSINVNPSGGTAPYTYTWSTAPVQSSATATGLTSGTYMVTVTDAHSCTTTAIAAVTEPTSLTATANTISNALCNGINTGSVNVSPSGGTLPYTYSWSTLPVQTAATATGLTAGTYTATVTDAHGCTVTASSTVTQPSTLAATASTLTNVSCNGGNNGSVSVLATGGTTPYVYSWSTTPVQTTSIATGLSAGTYVATVTDAHNCSVISTAVVTEPTALEATASTTTNVSCNGGANGSATVVPAEGTSPYTYSWSTSPVQTTATAEGLSAGTYTATVTDAHGCITRATATITEPAVLTATATTFANVSCNGGNNGWATVFPVGGTPLYKYMWSTIPMQDSSTAIGLVAGVYTVTVVDGNGCMTTATTTVTEPPLLTATTTVLTNVACNGGNNGSVNVVPVGGVLPYSYSWSTTPGQTTATATGLSVGNYTVTVMDSNGCSTTAAATIGQPDPLGVTVSASNILCNGGSATVTVAGTGGALPYVGVGTYNVTAGTYNYIVTDSNGCADSAAITVAQPDSISLTANITDASCAEGNNGAATIVAAGGTAPYTYQWDANAGSQQTATAANLKKGTYYVTVTDQNGCSKTAVVIINGDVSSLAISSDIISPKCYNDNNGSVTTNVTGGTPPYSYAWSNGSANMALDGLGAGEYKVIVTDAVGCSISGTYTVAQPDLVQVGLVPMVYPTGFNVSGYGASDGQVKAEVGGGTPAYTYLWSTGGTDAILDKVPAGTYSVIVTDQNGCMDTASVVLVQPVVLELPTGYSPNGDGKNDYFVIHGIEAYPNNQLVIFNRWGNEVYSAESYNNQWNGKNKDGKDLPDGTYFVMLSINGGAITRTGYVDLRR